MLSFDVDEFPIQRTDRETGDSVRTAMVRAFQGSGYCPRRFHADDQITVDGQSATSRTMLTRAHANSDVFVRTKAFQDEQIRDADPTNQ